MKIGQSNLITPDTNEQTLSIFSLAKFDNYDPANKVNDIALVEVDNITFKETLEVQRDKTLFQNVKKRGEDVVLFNLRIQFNISTAFKCRHLAESI